MTKHLILIGLPGVGKTTAGAAVARRLGRPFIDFDAVIEQRAGKPISRLFAEQGEAWFRDLEKALTAELLDAPSAVVAPGGGWVMNEGVVALVRPVASIIYLRARPETVLHRLGESRESRPLLRGAHPLEALTALLALREQAYSSADLVMDTDLLDPQQLIDKIAELASASGGG